jgi:hypothetical protein
MVIRSLNIFTILKLSTNSCTLAGQCIVYDVSTKNASCSGVNDGSASIQITTGIGPFVYLLLLISKYVIMVRIILPFE